MKRSAAQAWLVVGLVGFLASAPTGAAANGLELGPGGTRSMARGGAVLARPMDPMAMLHNPAGLPRLSGEQVMLNLDFAFHDMCFDPYGYYGWGIPPKEGGGVSDFGDPTSAEYTERRLDQVCNSAPVLPVPQMAWAFHVLDDLAFAIGFVAPTIVSGLQWGGDNGSIATSGGPRPTPTRYQMIRQEVLFGLNPTFSAGYRFSDALSVGLTLHIGMLKANAYAMTTVGSGTSPEDDMLTKLTVEDYFVPGVTASIHSEPLPGLSLMASARIFDDFDGPGEMTFTTGHYQSLRKGDFAPHKNDPVALDRVQVKVPWALNAAARYAQLLPGMEGKVGRTGGDPLATELWDVELDFTYNLNARVGQNQVSLGDDIELNFRRADGMPRTPARVLAEDVEDFAVERHLKNSIGLRLGGSFNPVPDLLGLSAGVFYENRGIDPDYATVDSFAFARVGFGVGATVRLGGFDLLVAYGHIFQETVDVAPPPHANWDRADPDDPTSGFDQRIPVDGSVEGVEPTADPRAPAPSQADGVASYQQAAAVETAQLRPRVVNAGSFSAGFNMFSVGVVYRY